MTLKYRESNQRQVIHSMPPEKIDLFKSLEGWAKDNILRHLKLVEKCWKPFEFLLHASFEGFCWLLIKLNFNNLASE